MKIENLTLEVSVKDSDMFENLVNLLVDSQILIERFKRGSENPFLCTEAKKHSTNINNFLDKLREE